MHSKAQGGYVKDLENLIYDTEKNNHFPELEESTGYTECQATSRCATLSPQNSLLRTLYGPRETFGVTFGRWKGSCCRFLLGWRICAGHEVLSHSCTLCLPFGSAVGVGRRVGPLDLLLRFSHFWAGCVFSSLRKSVGSPAGHLHPQSWRVGGGETLMWVLAPLCRFTSSVLAGFILSLLPLVTAVFPSQWLPCCLQASTRDTEATASVHSLTSSHN